MEQRGEVRIFQERVLGEERYWVFYGTPKQFSEMENPTDHPRYFTSAEAAKEYANFMQKFYYDEE